MWLAAAADTTSGSTVMQVTNKILEKKPKRLDIGLNVSILGTNVPLSPDWITDFTSIYMYMPFVYLLQLEKKKKMPKTSDASWRMLWASEETLIMICEGRNARKSLNESIVCLWISGINKQEDDGRCRYWFFYDLFSPSGSISLWRQTALMTDDTLNIQTKRRSSGKLNFPFTY